MTEPGDIGARRSPGGLFSMDAADNAEVVPPDPPRGPESLWSTEATPDGVDPAHDEFVDGEDPEAANGWGTGEPAGSGGPRSGPGFGVGSTPYADPWIHTMGSEGPAGPEGGDGGGRSGRASPRFGGGAASEPMSAGAGGRGNGSPFATAGVFSADPIARDEEILDEDPIDDVIDAEEVWTPTGPGPSVFSSGPERATSHAEARTQGTEPSVRPSEPGPDTAGPRGEGLWAGSEPAARPRPTHDGPAVRSEAVPPDVHGFDAAVDRLGAEDQERTKVPLSVCGALLAPGEQVVGVVTGQMLGQPAAVVVTATRVLVVNDRRWQPIVDVYPIDSSLVVRGRHDRSVAALSFADEERLSMVDGITEVDMAIELAAAIRNPSGPDPAT